MLQACCTSCRWVGCRQQHCLPTTLHTGADSGVQGVSREAGRPLGARALRGWWWLRLQEEAAKLLARCVRECAKEGVNFGGGVAEVGESEAEEEEAAPGERACMQGLQTLTALPAAPNCLHTAACTLPQSRWPPLPRRRRQAQPASRPPPPPPAPRPTPTATMRAQRLQAASQQPRQPPPAPRTSMMIPHGTARCPSPARLAAWCLRCTRPCGPRPRTCPRPRPRPPRRPA